MVGKAEMGVMPKRVCVKSRGEGDLMVERRWSKGWEGERKREDAINMTDGLIGDGTNQQRNYFGRDWELEREC